MLATLLTAIGFSGSGRSLLPPRVDMIEIQRSAALTRREEVLYDEVDENETEDKPWL
jgi:hypothetical protein